MWYSSFFEISCNKPACGTCIQGIFAPGDQRIFWRESRDPMLWAHNGVTLGSQTYLPNTPNTGDQIQIQIQIHGLKFDQIQIQIRRICICICKYKYVFDPSPGSHDTGSWNPTWCKTRHKPILHCQYHRCWCPDNARSQAIGTYDIDYGEPE